MPIIMIAFLIIGGATMPTVIEVEMNSMEACVGAGSSLSQTLDAAGICLDKLSGNTVIWGPRPEGEQPGSEPPPPPGDKIVPLPKEESH